MITYHSPDTWNGQRTEDRGPEVIAEGLPTPLPTRTAFGVPRPPVGLSVVLEETHGHVVGARETHTIRLDGTGRVESPFSPNFFKGLLSNKNHGSVVHNSLKEETCSERCRTGLIDRNLSP